MPLHNHHEDARPLMLGIHGLMTAQQIFHLQSEDDDKDKVVLFEEHTQKPHIIVIGQNLKRRLSLVSQNLPRPSRRLSNKFKRSLSFMARHSQDVASPQMPHTQALPTIISSPRSSRSPSLSFAPQVKMKIKPLVIPTHSSSNSSLSPITSPRNSPPPDFLLDDDPFANLTGKVCRQLSGKATGGDVKSPRSRLVNNDNIFEPLLELDDDDSSTSTPPATTSQSIPTSPTPTNSSGFRGMGVRSSFPSIASLSSSAGWSSSTSQPQPQSQRPTASPRPTSSPRPTTSPPARPHPPHHSSLSSPPTPLPLPHRLSPAHQRPAFKSRPSLPSLNTLAKINFVPGFGLRKVRKGKVGAGLPFEPWNDLGSRPNSSGETSPGIESASTSEHELADSKISMSSCPPSPPKSSFSVRRPSSSPTSSSQVQAHTGADMPPHSVSVAPISLGGVVFGYCDRGGGRSPPKSPPATSAAPQASLPSIPPPSKLMLRSSILLGDRMPLSNAAVDIDLTTALSIELDVTHGLDTNRILSSSPKETLEVGPHSPNSILALRHDDVHVYLGGGGGGIVDDDDVDQFMDQFMEHYDRLDREEDQREDASRQDQEEPGREEDNNALGKVYKRVVDEDGDEMQMQLTPSFTSLLATATAPAISPVDAVSSVSSSETMSDMSTATLTAFPRASSPILASDDSSLFDSYSYTYPYPSSGQNGEMGLEVKSVSNPSVSDSTPPASVTWSTSESSVSRSRSLSSTYTTLSGESETFSCPQSSVDGDDEVHIEHPPPPPLPMLVKSPIDPMLLEKRRMRTVALERGGRRDHQSSFLAISSGSSSSSSSNDDDEDRYGPVNSSPSQSQAVMNVNPRTHLSKTPSTISATPPGYMIPPSKRSPAASDKNGGRFSENEDENDEGDDDNDQEDDDDIPLAKRIPGALTAQKSIRHQVRQERERKKQEKALRGQAETSRTRFMTLRPAGALPSSSHDTAALVASQTTRNSRTLTRNGSKSLNPFSPEDLMRKLRDIDGVEAATTSPPVDASLYQQQALHSRLRSRSVTRSLRDVRPPSTTETLPPVPIPQSRPTSSHAQRTKSVKESLPYHYHTSPSPTPINSTYAPSSMTPLRPMRSFHFHRPSIDRRPFGMDDPRSVPLPLDAEKRISRNSTLVTRSRPSTREGPQQNFTFPTATSTPHHRSLSRSRSSAERTSITTNPEPVPPIPTARIGNGPNRISADADKHSRVPSRQHRPVPSTSSPADPLPVMSSKPGLVVQQRVFIGNMQRFNMVEIGASTTAGDVIEMIQAEGSLKDFAGSGGWMVFEVAQDFGMERPIRSFELVADVQASWNKDKMVNYLVLRMTSLEVPLNRSAIPSSSPTHSGYVEWEAKRGKWSKRFMQLREHSIWISKRDNGQDQVHLCSLSNFDAYEVTRTHRAPKPFAFSIKSTDNLSFFENTADYLHLFACSEKEGKIWMEKILVARSYVLFQERHVLFNPKTVGSNVSGVSRSGTRKAMIQRPHHDVFEPGSLLSKQQL